MQESVTTKLLESNKKTESVFESTNPMKNTTRMKPSFGNMGADPMACTEEQRVPKSLAAMVGDRKVDSDRKTN